MIRLLQFGNRRIDVRSILRISVRERERDSRALFNFWCCWEIWFGLNRTSHPDWVKMFGYFNGQIKLRAKQKFKFLSTTEHSEELTIGRHRTVVYWPSTRPNMPLQSDAPEASDTFRWQLWDKSRRRTWLKK